MISDYNGITLEISYIKIIGKFPNIWKLNNILLKSPYVKEEVLREVKKFINLNVNKNRSCQNFWDTDNTVRRGTCIALNAYIKKV